MAFCGLDSTQQEPTKQSVLYAHWVRISRKNLVCLHNSTTPPHKWVPTSSCGEIGTVGRPNRLKQSVFHRNLLVGIRLALAGTSLVRRRWIISAAMEMAISSGSSASMATPIGRCSSSIWSCVKPFLLQAGAHKRPSCGASPDSPGRQVWHAWPESPRRYRTCDPPWRRPPGRAGRWGTACSGSCSRPDDGRRHWAPIRGVSVPGRSSHATTAKPAAVSTRAVAAPTWPQPKI